MSRIQAWLSGRRSFLTKNGSLNSGGDGGPLLPARLGPADPPSVPPIVLDLTTTTGRSPVMRVVESHIGSWPTSGSTQMVTTGIPTNPPMAPHCQCRTTPSVPGAGGES